jgi:Ser/Thr protein kinase RdoA (MazF antagonist)
MTASIFSSDDAAVRIAHAVMPRWREAQGASVTPAKVRENAVLRLTNNLGVDYALRLHRPGYHTDESLRSEFAWMRALRDSGVLTPALVRSRAGLDFEIHSDGNTRYQVDLFEWIHADGPQLTLGAADIPLDVITAQYRLMGETMARVHEQSAGWIAPEGFVRHAWDVEGLVGESPLWGQFWNLRLLSCEQQQLMDTVRARLNSELRKMDTSRDSYGVIHADLMPDNVIVAKEGLYLIDFDDAGFGWYLFDIAASVFSFSNAPGFDSILHSFVSGYRLHRELSDTSLSLLPLFLAARGTTLMGWLHSRQVGTNPRAAWVINVACSAAERWLRTRA